MSPSYIVFMEKSTAILIPKISGACLEKRTKQCGKVPISVSLSAPCQLESVNSMSTALGALAAVGSDGC